MQKQTNFSIQSAAAYEQSNTLKHTTYTTNGLTTTAPVHNRINIKQITPHNQV
jgi:hypothetical protein